MQDSIYGSKTTMRRLVSIYAHNYQNIYVSVSSSFKLRTENTETEHACEIKVQIPNQGFQNMLVYIFRFFLLFTEYFASSQYKIHKVRFRFSNRLQKTSTLGPNKIRILAKGPWPGLGQKNKEDMTEFQQALLLALQARGQRSFMDSRLTYTRT